MKKVSADRDSFWWSCFSPFDFSNCFIFILLEQCKKSKSWLISRQKVQNSVQAIFSDFSYSWFFFNSLLLLSDSKEYYFFFTLSHITLTTKYLQKELVNCPSSQKFKYTFSSQKVLAAITAWRTTSGEHLIFHTSFQSSDTSISRSEVFNHQNSSQNSRVENNFQNNVVADWTNNSA